MNCRWNTNSQAWVVQGSWGSGEKPTNSSSPAECHWLPPRPIRPEPWVSREAAHPRTPVLSPTLSAYPPVPLARRNSRSVKVDNCEHDNLLEARHTRPKCGWRVWEWTINQMLSSDWLSVPDQLPYCLPHRCGRSETSGRYPLLVLEVLRFDVLSNSGYYSYCLWMYILCALTEPTLGLEPRVRRAW